MRNISLTLLAVGVAMAARAAAQTAVTQYPFCIQGLDNPGYSGCSFNTLQACQASASEPAGLNGPIVVGPPPPGN